MTDVKVQWWGYKHTSGTYQAKPYFEARDIMEANESEFCETVVGPFPAEDRDEALMIVQTLIASMNNDVPTEAEKELYYWQYDRTGSFGIHLFNALSVADGKNLSRLAMSFPEEVKAVKRYKNEPGYWENLVQRMKNHGL
jgi:hypothetical protein